MSKTKYRALLARLELSQQGMANLLGIGRRTSQGYAAGEPIPEPTAILLTLLADGKVTVADVEAARGRR
jgi:hypothetical protein